VRTIAIMLAAISLCACVSDAPPGADDVYGANYDNLKRAQDACNAKGGTLTLRSGGDQQSIADYACKRT
jgi:hypothetical protein